jgi:peptide/nickel transport system substrate-binding protein
MDDNYTSRKPTDAVDLARRTCPSQRLGARGELMTRRTLAGAAAVALAVGAAGCGSSGSSHSASSNSGPGSASTAGSGGGTASGLHLTPTTPAASGHLSSITWDLPFGEPTGLDPIKTGDYSPNTVLMNVCEGLFRITPDYKIVPNLAKSFHNVGRLETVYNLLPGVKFSDGTPMTAADVAASLLRNMDPKLGGIGGQFFQSVKSITATGPLQVTVKSKYPDEMFTEALGTEIDSVIKPSTALAAGNKYGTPAHPPVCTGPYKVADWKPGQSISLTVNRYYDRTYKPKVHTVNFQFITNSSTLTSALLSGQIDGTYEAPLTSLSTLKNSSMGKLYYGPSTQVFEFGPANPQTPMANATLRQALSMAIDRTTLVKSVFQGAGVPLRALVPPGAFGRGAGAPIYQAGYNALPDDLTANLAAAKKLVAKVGAPKSAMKIALPAGDQSQLQLATFVQAAGQSIGLNFKLDVMPPTEFSSLFYNAAYRKNVDLVLSAGYVEIPDPLTYAAIIVPKGALFNWINYVDPKVDQLLIDSDHQLNKAASARAFVRAQALYTKFLPTIPVASPYERLFMNKRISGAPASFAYINLPWAAMIGGTGK